MNRHLLFHLTIFIAIILLSGGCAKTNSTTKPTAAFIVSPNSGNLQTTFTFDASQGYDNSTGPVSGDEKVVRGGSVFNGADDCRVSDRYNLSPSNAHKEVGFRVVKLRLSIFGLILG